MYNQILGTPTREEIKCMNPNYTEFKFPQIKAHPWHKVHSLIPSDSEMLNDVDKPPEGMCLINDSYFSRFSIKECLPRQWI